MKGDPIIYTLQCMMGNSEFKQVLTLLLFEGLVLPLCMQCPYLRMTCHSSQQPFYTDQDTDGSRALMFSLWPLQHPVLVTAGFKSPIMQRSLIHEVSQVSSSCQHIHPSQWPPATLTWSNGHCMDMLISPHHTW